MTTTQLTTTSTAPAKAPTASGHKYLPYILKVGKKETPVADLADASCTFQEIRDEYLAQGGRGSELPEGKITIGKTKFRVSFNGRVWLVLGTGLNDDQLVLEAQR